MQDVGDDDQVVATGFSGSEVLGRRSHKSNPRALATVQSARRFADIDTGHSGIRESAHYPFGNHPVTAADFEDRTRAADQRVDRADKVVKVDEYASVEL